MILIWYVLYCPGGREETIIRSCRQHLSGKAVSDVFCFSYEKMRRFRKQWHSETLPMFPGYVFLESKDEALLTEELRQYHSVVKVLEYHRGLSKVSPEEEHLLRQLCGSCHHMDMSRGVIRDGITHVTEGPLKGKEQLIRKIDRHKRVAMLDTVLSRGPADVWTGLEIISKN